MPSGEIVSAGDSLVGRVLDDRYQVIARVGRGGHGTVYRGLHLQLEREVAIKVMATPGEGVERRFRREAKAQARLRHPAVVKLLDFGRDHDGNPYMVQEFVDGEVLTAHLKRGVPPLDETVDLIGDVLDALAEAHALGLVHRDVKPANIMVARGPRRVEARLLDFGVVKLLDPDSHTRLTRAGVLVGTPGYMAPEQVALTPVSPATDLYSVGVVLYQMLAGQRPYRGTIKQVLRAQLHDDPPPLPATAHAGLGAVALRAMAREPADRFPSAEAMADALLVAARGASAPFPTRRMTGPLGAAGPPASTPTPPLSQPPVRGAMSDHPAQPQTPPSPTFTPPSMPPAPSWPSDAAPSITTAARPRRASLGLVALLAVALAVATAAVTLWVAQDEVDGDVLRLSAGTQPQAPPQVLRPPPAAPARVTPIATPPPTMPVVQVSSAEDAAVPEDAAPDAATEPEAESGADTAATRRPARKPRPSPPSRRSDRRAQLAPEPEPAPAAPAPAAPDAGAPEPRVIMARRLETQIADAFETCRCDDASTLVERLARLDPASARLRRSAHRRRCRLALPGNCVTGDRP